MPGAESQASPPPPPASQQAGAAAAAGGKGGAETPGGGKGGGGADGAVTDPNSLLPTPDSPRTFASRQRELARDLVIKEQQIEYLISVLPGIGSSEKEQEGRIRELEKELRVVEEEREAKVKDLRVMRRKLETVLGAVETGVYGNRERSRVNN